MGVIALTAGVLGILATQGVGLGSLNALGTILPQPCYALMSGLGGVLLLGCGGIIIFKSIKHKNLKKNLPVQQLSAQPIAEEKKYKVELSGSDDDPIPTSCKIITHEKVMVFTKIEECVAKIRKLEKQGFSNIEEIAETEQAAAPSPLPNAMMQGHPGMYMAGLIVTLISIPAFILPIFFPFPYCWVLQAVALGVLTAVSYGIINDQFATRQSIHYFTNGHTPFHKRLLETDNPTANGVIWGIRATWVLGLVAGAVMGLVVAVPHIYAFNPLYLAPIAGIGSLGVNIYAQIKSKQLEKACRHPIMKRRIKRFFDDRQINPREGFHKVELNRVPEGERPGWLGVGKRNGIGYAAMPALGATLIAASIATRILLVVI